MGHTWQPLTKALCWPAGEEAGEAPSVEGSEGKPAATVSAVGGETTFTTNALRRVVLLVVIAAAKTRCVESGSHAGRPSWPETRVAVEAAPVRLRTRSVNAVGSCRR